MIKIEQVIQIIVVLVGVFGGGIGLYYERQRAKLKKDGVQTEAQRLVNLMAEEAIAREKILQNRVVLLEAEVSRIPALEAKIKTLTEQLERVLGASAYAVEGDLATFRG